MKPRRRPGARALAGLAAAVLAIAAVAVVVVAGRAAPVSARSLRIAVTDGPLGNQDVVLDATFFTPAGTGRAPAILLAHGFGETKNAVRPQAEQLARAGFAVLTWSARGFGKSTGQIALDSPDYEVKDVEQLIGWLARQPRVLLDHPGDPRVGIAGASYGGGIALLAAAYDHRVDAIVPQITWNNLATALFPDAAGGGPQDGVFKKQWAGLLFTQGSVGFGAAGQRTAGQGTSGQGTAGQGTAGQGTSGQGTPARTAASRAGPARRPWRRPPSAAGSGPRSAPSTGRSPRSGSRPRRRSRCCSGPARRASPAGSMSLPCSYRASTTRCSGWTRRTRTTRPSGATAPRSTWSGLPAGTTAATRRPAGSTR